MSGADEFRTQPARDRAIGASLDSGETSDDRAVLTIAMGRAIYVEMAATLARSFRQWNRGNGIRFVVVTDQPHLWPNDLKEIDLIATAAGTYGHGFSPKLHIDRLAPAARTLFLDADCLCYGSLELFFARFAGRAVSVIGDQISAGNFFGDVAERCVRFNVPSVPWFIGGAYYVEPGPLCSSVYDMARQLEERYDEIGLVPLRGGPNEEPLISIAMAAHGLTALADDGTLKAEPISFPGGIDVDVFSGRAVLWIDPSAPATPTIHRLTRAAPLVVHYHGDWAQRDPYLREAFRLRLAVSRGWPLSLATLAAWTISSLPRAIGNLAKDTLRPLYRRLGGVRPIRPTAREA